MAITTEKIINNMCKKINYSIKKKNGQIYILKSKESKSDIMVYLDEMTGNIHSKGTDMNMSELFQKSYKELENPYPKVKVVQETKKQQERFDRETTTRKLRKGVQSELQKGYNRRWDAIHKHRVFLNELRNYSKEMMSIVQRITYTNKVFATEEEEYQFVCKFGRGWWDSILRHVNEDNRKKLAAFAEDFGAMDY